MDRCGSVFDKVASNHTHQYGHQICKYPMDHVEQFNGMKRVGILTENQYTFA